MTKYLKNAGLFLAYILAGTLAGAAAGYAVGAVGGIALTAYNNNFLTGTSPQGSYMWWARAGGSFFAVFGAAPGFAVGFVVGLGKVLIKSDAGKARIARSK